ncbi:hypothetical protein J6590_030741 [Homalodisca vitripennis]|nr:hypothetical protein J6590_030741 [Homalodisca vitripennis]
MHKGIALTFPLNPNITSLSYKVAVNFNRKSYNATSQPLPHGRDSPFFGVRGGRTGKGRGRLPTVCG